ncbi:hypothetical protein MPSEU_000826200 [Mayamaea pseudoterrestris]|nr:hypothetical protein MPSEU_000826200 [Mayamaea pseudoterrestris]
MEYERSTHARNWMFNVDTLLSCRQQAISIDGAHCKARKFASGYHHRNQSNHEACSPISSSINGFSMEDQELVLYIHIHQLESLCGPKALFDGLRTSERVLCTAITFVKRFYLSNSVLDFDPRQICMAAAFLAAKVEEEKIELDLLSHATKFVKSSAISSPLLCQELSYVTISQIESAEKILMEGLNYEFINHHANVTLRNVARELSKWSSDATATIDPNTKSLSNDALHRSTSDHILVHLLEMETRTLMCTDSAFLYAPATLGLAIATVALGSIDNRRCNVEFMQDYLVAQFPLKSEDELVKLYREVNSAAIMLLSNPLLSHSAIYTLNDNGVVSNASIETALSKKRRLQSSRPAGDTALATRTRHAQKRNWSHEMFQNHGQDSCRYSKIAKITP